MKTLDDNILTTRTVFELFGAAAAEALREEAVKKWPKLGGIT